jgi:hypothetical protein
VLVAERLRVADNGALGTKTEPGMKLMFIATVAATGIAAGVAAARW